MGKALINIKKNVSFMLVDKLILDSILLFPLYTEYATETGKGNFKKKEREQKRQIIFYFIFNRRAYFFNLQNYIPFFFFSKACL